MDAGRASLHLRRYLHSRLEYYTVKLAFFEAANPQWVPGITSLFGLPRASLRDLERGRFQCSLCQVRRLGGGVYVVQASWSMEDHGSVRRVSLGGR
jgi:hypothetical protein